MNEHRPDLQPPEWLQIQEALRDIRNSYDVGPDDIIRSSGKFEGEDIAAVYFYDAMMNGDGEYVEGVTIFEPTSLEREVFGLSDLFVYLYETDDGFVYLAQATTDEINLLYENG